jgi:hypothetical protein
MRILALKVGDLMRRERSINLVFKRELSEIFGKKNSYFRPILLVGSTRWAKLLGGAYFISKNVVLSAGYQMPTMGSKSQDAVVFEITYIPL